jgi:large subunit ribosomal protein L3
MSKFILGRKLGMSEMFIDDRIVPITLIEAGPVFITQIKTKEKDGYSAVQIGFLKQKEKRLSKAVLNHLGELGGFKYLKEFRIKEKEELKRGDEINLSIFKKGDKVKLSGISKAKGFQGVVKRHGFHGSPKTHGQKHTLRAPGSIGSTGPQRVMKGKKMAGRMGGKRITLKRGKIVFLDKEENILAIKGSIPGRKGTIIEISSN